MSEIRKALAEVDAACPCHGHWSSILLCGVTCGCYFGAKSQSDAIQVTDCRWPGHAAARALVEACAAIAESGAATCVGYGGLSVAASGGDWKNPMAHSDAHDYCHRSLDIAADIRAALEAPIGHSNV